MTVRRLRVDVRGLVQGVGFRPFVYRLAKDLDLAGWVVNDGRGVVAEVEGIESSLGLFKARLLSETPPRARVDEVLDAWLDPVGLGPFAILASDAGDAPSVPVLPDAAPCEACLRETRDPVDRRHAYPFTNCTHCGPRFTIVTGLPYDRPRTTMAGFTLCEACRREYGNPADRRFHAQPLACPACGPRAVLRSATGDTIAEGGEALAHAARAVRDGRIVALKGLGGFQLLVDARNEESVRLLRERKRRFEKPFALMVADVAAAGSLGRVSVEEAQALEGPEAPILLLERRGEGEVAPSVAPRNARLGLMLPATPLHHLLMEAIDRPVVCTSGNASDEPICTDEDEALDRLSGIADLFLVHDRPIARHADDSVAWIVEGATRLIRRARGFAPAPVRVAGGGPHVLAVGAHQKNAVALAVGDRVFVSQHVGDLDTPQARDAFRRVIDDFLLLWDARPAAIAHDLHPDYASTRFAEEAHAGEHGARLAGIPLVPVQHHHAHLAACLAENGASDETLGIVWDGTGYGTDGTIWGGEFLSGTAAGFRRRGHLRTFRLPGGEAAVREPRRTALGALREIGLESAPGLFSVDERRALETMIDRGIHAPVTSSAGRLFDAVASIAGLRQTTSFEGQAAMDLEFAVDPEEDGAYPFDLGAGDPIVVDWAPAIAGAREDARRGAASGKIAARFHAGLVEAAVAVARRVGLSRVALTGGCFQNGVLTRSLVRRLRQEGFDVLLHRHVPPNDGGIALGQTAVAAARLLSGPREG